MQAFQLAASVRDSVKYETTGKTEKPQQHQPRGQDGGRKPWNEAGLQEFGKDG